MSDPHIAWDLYTQRQDEQRAETRKANPGCGSCGKYIESDYDQEHGKCVLIGELVPASGYDFVPCEYDDWSEV